MRATTLPVLIAAGIAALLSGCSSLELPVATVAQLAKPDRIWANTPPRDRVRARVRFRFPDCSFATPEEEQQFNESLVELRRIGQDLISAVESGELASGTYVLACVLLEWIGASLLDACEQDAPSGAVSSAALAAEAGERLGVVVSAGLSERGTTLTDVERMLRELDRAISRRSILLEAVT